MFLPRSLRFCFRVPVWSVVGTTRSRVDAKVMASITTRSKANTYIVY
jgi:hypothetical protein